MKLSSVEDREVHEFRNSPSSSTKVFEWVAHVARLPQFGLFEWLAAQHNSTSPRISTASQAKLSCVQRAQRSSRKAAHPKRISNASQAKLNAELTSPAHISIASQAKLSCAQRAQLIPSASQAKLNAASTSSAHLKRIKHISSEAQCSSRSSSHPKRISSASLAHL